MTTVSQLIEQISSHLHNFTGTLEAATYLIDDVSDSDTNFLVQHPTKITQGLVEIDDELLHVDTVGSTSIEMAPYGRGVSGSVAAAHAVNTKVVNDPLFPRVRIYDAIKRGILAAQPDLFAVATTEFTSSPVQTTYEIPAAVDRVLKVQYEMIGPSQEWLTIPYWTIDHNAATGTGKALVLHTAIQPGRTVQVTYAGRYTSPTSTSDVLESTCKIPESAHEVLLWYACGQLVQFMELPRLNLRAVEQQARAQGLQVGDPSKIAAQMFALYERAKAQERKRLLMTHPPAKRYATR